MYRQYDFKCILPTRCNLLDYHLVNLTRFTVFLWCSYLQAVGYNSIEAEDWELATSGEEMSKLESLLLDKNRKMEHELTQLKV